MKLHSVKPQDEFPLMMKQWCNANKALKEFIVNPNRVLPIVQPKPINCVNLTRWNDWAKFWDSIENANEFYPHHLVYKPTSYFVEACFGMQQLIYILANKGTGEHRGKAFDDACKEITPYVNSLFYRVCEKELHVNFTFFLSFFYLLRNNLDEKYGCQMETVWKILNAMGTLIEAEFDGITKKYTTYTNCEFRFKKTNPYVMDFYDVGTNKKNSIGVHQRPVWENCRTYIKQIEKGEIKNFKTEKLF
jgi:hypothetical protein